MSRFFLVPVIFLFFFHDHAYAYIDPGTGGIILQAILGFIAAVGATVTIYWRKFKEFIKKIFKSKNKVD